MRREDVELRSALRELAELDPVGFARLAARATAALAAVRRRKAMTGRTRAR
jgi:hypothetical protein